MAKEKGYFKAHGLDVEIKKINDDVDIIEDVLSQKTHYAIGRSSLIIDRLNGKEIVLLSAIFQHSPLVLLTLKKSGIKSPKDLMHKNIMITTDARTTVSIHAMLSSTGINLNDLNFQLHSYNINDLINGKTDAMGCYLSNEPYVLNLKNIPYNVLNPADYGFDFYGDTLFTSTKELEEHPHDVYNFNQAVLEGWTYAFNNIGETVNIIYNKYNPQNKSVDALLFEAYTLKKLAEFDQGNLGKISLDKIKEIGKIYSVLGFTNNPHTILNDFVYTTDLVLFNKEEKEFLSKNSVEFIVNESKPFYISNGDRINGIGMDIIQTIAQKLPTKSSVEIIKNPKVVKKELNRTASLKLVISEEDLNDSNMLYTHPMKQYKFAIATRNNENFIASTSELNGKTVIIPKHSTLSTLIKDKYPNINFIEVKDITTALDLVSKGQAFAAIDIVPNLIYTIKNHSLSNIKITGTTEFKFALQFMLNKKYQELLPIINKITAQFSEKTISDIEEEYFHIQYETSIDYTLLYKVGLPLCAFICIFAFYNYRLRAEIKKRKIIETKLYSAATIDSLTQIYNRRKIDAIFKMQLSLTKRYKRPLSIIFFDIDDFKKINDTFGHHLADTILKDLSALVKKNLRETDSLGRWGGEEFLVVIPEIKLKDAIIVAENLKKAINTFSFKINSHVTCSFGVTQYYPDDDENSMLKRADDLMYKVKENGKNSIKAE
ncbi:MAG: diguanylate cyclase [Candidatus Marinarcus sp.]|uniref:transporter substrate-binding domain-containing diguanylate cyclase n=1 Tax=Candidatus Marinarcus sp. TaxID=3100987 RepID=UPI003B00CABC